MNQLDRKSIYDSGWEIHRLSEDVVHKAEPSKKILAYIRNHAQYIVDVIDCHIRASAKRKAKEVKKGVDKPKGVRYHV